MSTCAADGCSNEASARYRRTVCAEHANASVVYVSGEYCRLCKRCKTLHSVHSFNGSNTSCARSLLRYRRNRSNRANRATRSPDNRTYLSPECLQTGTGDNAGSVVLNCEDEHDSNYIDDGPFSVRTAQEMPPNQQFQPQHPPPNVSQMHMPNLSGRSQQNEFALPLPDEKAHEQNAPQEAAVLHSVSLKLFQIEPYQLPESFRQALLRWLSMRPIIMNAYIISGCAEMRCDTIGPHSRRIQPTLLFCQRLHELLGEFVLHHNGLLVMASNCGPTLSGSSSTISATDIPGSGDGESSNSDENPQRELEDASEDSSTETGYEPDTREENDGQAQESSEPVEQAESTAQRKEQEQHGSADLTLKSVSWICNDEGEYQLEMRCRWPLGQNGQRLYIYTNLHTLMVPISEAAVYSGDDKAAMTSSLQRNQLPEEGFAVVELAEDVVRDSGGQARSNAVPVVITNNSEIASEIDEASQLMAMQERDLTEPFHRGHMAALLYAIGNGLAGNLQQGNMLKVARVCREIGWQSTGRRLGNASGAPT